MSNSPSRSTVEVPNKSKTGSTEDEGSLRTFNPSSSLSGDSTNFSRSAVRVGTPTYYARKTNDNRYYEPWMDTVTPGKFDKFQSTIFPIVEEIISRPRYANHHFTQRWNSLKRAPRTPLSNSITWRNIKIIMGISSIFQYKDFLQQCPEIEKYIRIVPSNTTKNGFDYGVYESNNEELDITNSPKTPKIPVQANPPAVTPKPDEVDVNPKGFEIDVKERVDNSLPLNQPSVQTDPEIISIADVPLQAANLMDTPKHVNGQSENQNDNSLAQLTMPAFETSATPTDNIEWPTDDKTNGFQEVHYRLYASVTTWMQQDDAVKHVFHQKWTKAVFAGLTATTMLCFKHVFLKILRWET